MQIQALKIATRSRRQAMDWSLVLLSQDIQAVIDHDQETGSWALVVAPEDHAKALATLEQYQRENRGWPWQQRLPVPGLQFDWGSVAWLFLVLVFYWLQKRTNLEAAGLMDNRLVASGQWWRLFTATWLHADVAHLATNSALGLVLLGLTMGRYGTATGLLTASLAGAAGNLFTGLVSTAPHQSLGASGTIMGALGLLAVSSWTHWHGHPKRLRLALGGFVAGLMLFVLLGFTPGTDILAHFGGFMSGLLGGVILTLFPKLSRPGANLVSGILFVASVIIPWWAALRGH